MRAAPNLRLDSFNGDVNRKTPFRYNILPKIIFGPWASGGQFP